jgi:hypothetical protein
VYGSTFLLEWLDLGAMASAAALQLLDGRPAGTAGSPSGG